MYANSVSHTAACSILQYIIRSCCSVGHFVGEYPVLTIILTFIICGLCGIGLKTFSETEEQEKLWVPQSSRLINEKAWVDQVFPDQTRFVAIVVESQTNVLTPTFLRAVSFFFFFVQNLRYLQIYVTVMTFPFFFLT